MKGLILYTDGGAKINPGPAGYGVHGYFFSPTHPKQGSGAEVILTQFGYQTLEQFAHQHNTKPNKKDIAEKAQKLSDNEEENLQLLKITDLAYQVTPITYVDSHYAFDTEVTNNYAELSALKHAFQYVLEQHPDINYLRVYTDSEYVVRGFNEYLDRWYNCNFIKSDGKEVANRELWEEVVYLKHKLAKLNLNYSVQWIKGHANHLGNERADRLATIGTNIAEHTSLLTKSAKTKTIETPAKGYWKDNIEHPDLFSNRYVLFNPAQITDSPVTFVTCSIDEHLRFLGKKHTTFGLSIVMPDTNYTNLKYTALKDVIKRQSDLLEHQHVTVAVNTETLFSHDVFNDYVMAGVQAYTVNNDYKHELFTVDRTALRAAITQVLIPPYLTYQLEEEIDFLANILNEYKENKDTISATDITHYFYETKTDKKGKEETIFKPSLGTGLSNMHIQHTYKSVSDPSNPKIYDAYTAETIIVMGIDLPDRNTLKRLETKSPKVYMLTQAINSHIFRYAILTESSEGAIISAGVYANTRLIKLDQIKRVYP